eukprot:1126354-Pelagomonas_calceolata.AAC.2
MARAARPAQLPRLLLPLLRQLPLPLLIPFFNVCFLRVLPFPAVLLVAPLFVILCGAPHPGGSMVHCVLFQCI